MGFTYSLYSEFKELRIIYITIDLTENFKSDPTKHDTVSDGWLILLHKQLSMKIYKWKKLDRGR